MILKWNGMDLALEENHGTWRCRDLYGGRGSLDVSRVGEEGPWFCFLWFFGTRTRFEVYGCRTPQEAVDQVFDKAMYAFELLGLALHGPGAGS